MFNHAVICEYNPFHSGHEYQLSQIKKSGGSVTAVMSGDFCQRGEAAIIDKYERAKAALRGGADLVIELPFPYSCGGAERFAFGAVDIISRLGFIDKLSFGSECGDASLIEKTAKNILSDEFDRALGENMRANSERPYGTVYFDTYREIFGDDGVFGGSNNILGVSYASEIIKKNVAIELSTIKRIGQAYGGEGEGMASATSVREALFSKGADAVKDMLPQYSYDILRSEHENGKIADPERFFAVFASFLRTRSAQDIAEFAENDISLASRLIKAGNEAHSMAELYSLAQTKKYSLSRLRRALLFSYFGVTKEMLCAPPAYTVLLAANDKGRELLAIARKKADIPIITKPADYERYGEEVKTAFELSKKAAAVRLLAQESVGASSDIMKKKPYIEK